MSEHDAPAPMKLTQISIVVRDIAVTRARWSALIGKPLADGVLFLAFWQPGENDTPWRRHLDAHGEGVMDLEFEAPTLDAVVDALDRKAYHVGNFSSSSYNLFAARDLLAVDLNVTVRD
ncbi:hypothetical protein [Microbacterium pumilum]|uniref:VOC family protein n=1 Tax=Microbacterium pumilum TaxID=344165 RepID=A0ABP5D5E9_9MICO